MKELNLKLEKQFSDMCKTGKLFRVEMSGQEVWELYLSSFEKDPKFRDPESSTHNCNLCKNSLRRYGNIVSISENFEITTLFDFEIEGEFSPVVKELSAKIKSSKISEVFFETFDELNILPYEKCTKQNLKFQLGVDKNIKRYTKEEAEEATTARENKEHNQKILTLISEKKDDELKGKSVAQLEKLLK